MQLDLFLPEGRNVPSEDDFLMQMERDKWKTSVNNHDTYREESIQISVNEASLGSLDSVNLFSTIPDYVARQLKGIQWVSVKALRLN